MWCIISPDRRLHVTDIFIISDMLSGQFNTILARGREA